MREAQAYFPCPRSPEHTTPLCILEGLRGHIVPDWRDGCPKRPPTAAQASLSYTKRRAPPA